jgi:hypothetical protein
VRDSREVERADPTVESNRRPPRADHGKIHGGSPSVTVIISTAVTVSLLAYVISVGTGRGSATHLATVLQHPWWLILGLMIPYVACRAFVWRQLLLELGIALRSWCR